MNIRIPTVAEIRQDLLAMPPDEIAGTAGLEMHCLVARALERRNPDVLFAVEYAGGQGGFQVSDDGICWGESRPLPEPLAQLAERFDGWDPHLDIGIADRTAAEILAAWDQLAGADR